MKLLGLDPAISCGFAWSDGERLEYGVWELAGRGEEHHGNRLIRLREHLQHAANTWGVDRIAFEDASFGAVNAHTQAMHNMLRGVIVLFAAEQAIQFAAFKPATIKKFATGNGRAKKPDMISALHRHYEITIQSSDVADAIWVLKLAEQYKPSVTKQLPKARRAKKSKELRLF